VFSWTYTGAKPGWVVFTTTVTGTDQVSGWPVALGPVISNVETIQTPAALAVTVTSSKAVACVGDDFTVTVRADNSGQAQANGVSVAVPWQSGAGSVAGAIGPTPAAPLSVPGGAWVDFTWTVTAATAGAVSFASTATGVDINSGLAVSAGPSSSGAVSLNLKGSLETALSFFPVALSTAQDTIVVLTVSNTGGGAVTGVVPDLIIDDGAGVLTYSSGPFPAPPVNIPGGGKVIYTWTWTGAAIGTAEFSATVTGADACTALTATATGTVAVQQAAALAAALNAFPSPRDTGQAFWVTLTVTNTGGATANSVNAWPFVISGAGGLAKSPATPTPPLPMNIPGGSWVTFTWTFTGSLAGVSWLTTTVTGIDANSAAALTFGPVASDQVTVQLPAVVDASIAAPAGAACVGESFQVNVTVSNTGGATAAGVFPAVPEVTGGGVVSAAGPSPAAAQDIPGGGMVVFTWTYTAVSAGSATFSTTVTGTDANTGTVLTVGPLATAVLTLAQPGALIAGMVSPAVISTGQSALVVLTVRNVGGSTVNGVTPELEEAPGAAAVSLSAGPWPAGGVNLAPGIAQVWTWTFTGAASGAVVFSATATGTDACTFRAASANSPMLVQAAAALAGNFTANPDPLNGGMSTMVMLTVSNTGEADALAVVPDVMVVDGTGVVTYVGGPYPGGSVTIPGGANVVFTWTYTAVSAGYVGFTTTVTGTEANMLTALTAVPVSATVFISTQAWLTSSLGLFPATVSAGQAFSVIMTVNNTGGNTAQGLVPVLLSTGTAPLTLLGSPPGFAVDLNGGSSTGYSWTWRADWTGTLGFSATATAVDALIGATLFTTSTAVGVSQVPAALVASTAVSATTIFVGQDVLVMLTVTNTGQATTTVFLAVEGFVGTGSVSPQGGPTPVPPFLLSGGSSITMTWTYTGAAIGPGFFSGTVSGWDFNSGSLVGASAVSPNVKVELSDLTIVGMTVSQSSVGLDAVITVVMTVSNTGSITQYGVVPQPVVTEGTGELVKVSGPVPASADLTQGQSAAFIWTFRATRGGTVTLSGAVTSGSGFTTPPASVIVVIIETGKDLDHMLVYPSPFKPGEAVGGVLKFRQMPPLTVLTVYTVAGERVCEMKADINGTVLWNGKNGDGTRVVPGVYIWLAKSPAGQKRIGKVQVAP